MEHGAPCSIAYHSLFLLLYCSLASLQFWWVGGQDSGQGTRRVADPSIQNWCEREAQRHRLPLVHGVGNHRPRIRQSRNGLSRGHPQRRLQSLVMGMSATETEQPWDVCPHRTL